MRKLNIVFILINAQAKANDDKVKSFVEKLSLPDICVAVSPISCAYDIDLCHYISDLLSSSFYSRMEFLKIARMTSNCSYEQRYNLDYRNIKQIIDLGFQNIFLIGQETSIFYIKYLRNNLFEKNDFSYIFSAKRLLYSTEKILSREEL